MTGLRIAPRKNKNKFRLTRRTVLGNMAQIEIVVITDNPLLRVFAFVGKSLELARLKRRKAK